jgi:alkylated DNA repair dioxygenase AlkB
MDKFIKQSEPERIVSPIPGLTLITNFITPKEEQILIKTICQQEWNRSLKRYTQHYGYEYIYTQRRIDESNYLGPLPDWFDFLLERISSWELLEKNPQQAIINRYLPGEGISSHIDSSVFGSQICSLSLGSSCEFIFKQPGEDPIPIYLKPRTLLIMSGESRYEWSHGIPNRKYDIVKGTKIERSTRYSITFRTIA